MPDTQPPPVHKRCASFPDPAFRVLLGTLRAHTVPNADSKIEGDKDATLSCLQEFHAQVLGIIDGAIQEYGNGQRSEEFGMITKRCICCGKRRPSYLFDYNRSRAPMLPGQVILPLRLG